MSSLERVMFRYKRIIPKFDDFLRCMKTPLPRTVRINTLKADSEEILQSLSEHGVIFKTFNWYEYGLRLLNVSSPGNLIEYFLGYIHTQEEVSMIPPIVLEPKPGELILDMCAAPGSKATQISQIMCNTGHVIANDVDLRRISMLKSNYERLGVLNMSITVYDGRKFPNISFDKILVDAPCSCEGIYRKNPSVFDNWSLKVIKNLSRLQKRLLSRAIQIAKRGGTVVYSTCTFSPEENEAVIDYVLSIYEGMIKLEEIKLDLEYCSGIKEWNGIKFNDEISLCARFYPHLNDTGGLFVAKIRKI